jgi:hypothetical protein
LRRTVLSTGRITPYLKPATPYSHRSAFSGSELAPRRAGPSMAAGARTWGAYQHYGNPYFRFFRAGR